MQPHHGLYLGTLAHPDSLVEDVPGALVAVAGAREGWERVVFQRAQARVTHVDPAASLTSGFYEVSLTMDPSSAAAWAAFTAAHLQDHVAFIRDDLVLEAPIIEERVTSGKIALTTETAQGADQLAQLAGRPA